MDQNLISKLKSSIEKIENKSAKIYFFVQDTKGNAKASIKYIYDIALVLKNAGYNPHILTEKNDYTKVSTWLSTEYDELPHRSVEGQNLEISPEDLIVIPELYGFVMDQIKNLPCGKIVLSQSYDYIVETLQPGQSWSTFNFTKCITTTEQQKQHISNIMRNISIDILKPRISKTFTKASLPQKPIIGVHSRDQRDSLKLIKSFYLAYPQFRWITFRDLRGLSESDLATTIKDCFACVWVDPISSFGTFPLECMKTGTPVIGLVPNMVPEWMNEKNGIWVQNQNQLLTVVVEFLQNWLEDNINQELYENMNETSQKYTDNENFETEVIDLFSGYLNTRKESFTDQLNKLEN